jgi:hypothetical protein
LSSEARLASASHVIVTGPRQAVLENAVAVLKAGAKGSATAVTGFVSDMAGLADSEELWNNLKRSGIVTVFLVLNGLATEPPMPLLKAGLEIV